MAEPELFEQLDRAIESMLSGAEAAAVGERELAALAAIVVIAVLLLLSRPRGAWLRLLALSLLLLALANPSFTREEREPLSSVAAVIVDKSPSQNFGDRTNETSRAQQALVESLKKIPGLEVRVVEAGHADGEAQGGMQ